MYHVLGGKRDEKKKIISFGIDSSDDNVRGSRMWKQ